MLEYLDTLPNVMFVLHEIMADLTGTAIKLMSFVAVLVVLIHGILVLLIMECFHKFSRKYGNLRYKQVDILVYFIVVLLILLSHLIDIFVWTYAMVSVNVFPGVIKTFYFAGEMYTNLDHNDPAYKLGPQWNMLPILISFSGLFAVAISGSALYGLLVATFSVPDRK
jgi:hypothetical protein